MTLSPALRSRLAGLARSRRILDLAAKFIPAPAGLFAPPRSIHLALLWGIGDAVTALPLIQALKSKWPEARLILLGKPWLAELFEGEGVECAPLEAPWTAFSRKYRIWDKSWRRFLGQLRTLRKSPADLWINFRFDPRDVILARCSGAHAIAGFGAAGAARWLAFDFPADERTFLRLYSGAVAAGLATAITESPQSPIPEFANRPEKSGKIEHAIVAFGASHPIRRWDPAKIGAVIRGLSERGLGVTVIDGNWGGGLMDLKREIGRADLFVGADSGPLHIASALGIPTIAVFGPGSLERFAPRRTSDCAIYEEIECRPCFDRCLYPRPLCLDRLEPRRILDAVDRVIMR